MPGDRKKAGLITEHDQCDPCQVTEKAGLITEHDQCDPCHVRKGFRSHDQWIHGLEKRRVCY